MNQVTHKGLLDTGSQITTVAEWLCREQLPDTPVEPLDVCLQINVAGGHTLGYQGVVILNLEFPGSGVTDAFPTPVLVVNNTEHNKMVPFIIGTNVIDSCTQASTSFLDMSEPWKLAHRPYHRSPSCANFTK